MKIKITYTHTHTHSALERPALVIHGLMFLSPRSGKRNRRLDPSCVSERDSVAKAVG